MKKQIKQLKIGSTHCVAEGNDNYRTFKVVELNLRALGNKMNELIRVVNDLQRRRNR